MSYAIRAIPGNAPGKGFPAMSQHSETNTTESQAEGGLPEEGQQALSTLQNLWAAQGQGSHNVDQSCETSSPGGSQCKATKSMGFEGIIDEVEATTDTAEAVDNVQTAWRKKLEQDGKLRHEGKSIREMVLGSDSEAGQ